MDLEIEIVSTPLIFHCVCTYWFAIATCKHDQLAMDLEIVSTPLIFLNYLKKKNCKSSSNLYLSIAISILVKCALYLYLQVCNCILLLANMTNLRLNLELESKRVLRKWIYSPMPSTPQKRSEILEKLAPTDLTKYAIFSLIFVA